MNILKKKTKRKQKEHIPKYPEKLPGSFWGITTFYNPCKYRNKLRNYNKFRKISKNQGLKLLCIELAFGDSKFELKKGDADILIQLRTKSLLWQKERLINLGLEYLPKDCDKFAWLDSDIIFQNNNWINETCNLLESYVIVQPFSSVILLPDNYKASPNKSSLKIKKGEKYYGIAYGIVHSGKKILGPPMHRYYHPGLAWAVRRKLFDKNKLYDRLIVGGADKLMVHAFYGNKDYLTRDSSYSLELIEDKSEWSDKIYKHAKGSVYYTKGLVFHLWHGKIKNRFYGLRKQILKRYNFNPKTDIRLNKEGCWDWATNKPRLHKFIKRYFWMRNEQGSFFRDIILFFYRINQKIFLLKHKMLGLIEIFLKKHYPKSYYFLKKFL